MVRINIPARCRGLAAAAFAAALLGAAAALGLAQSARQVNATLDALFGEHAPYEHFLAALQKAVATGDKQAVAGMVDYPLTAQVAGRAVRITDARRFVAHWDKVMTPKVTAAIRKQTYPTLFANAEGVMIGNGEVWFSGVGDAGAVRITGING